jgi:hypothetical protein
MRSPTATSARVAERTPRTTYLVEDETLTVTVLPAAVVIVIADEVLPPTVPVTTEGAIVTELAVKEPDESTLPWATIRAPATSALLLTLAPA